MYSQRMTFQIKAGKQPKHAAVSKLSGTGPKDGYARVQVWGHGTWGLKMWNMGTQH